MSEEDYLVPLDVGGLTVPLIFAYHHLLHEGVAARFNEATNSYGIDSLFVPRSQQVAARAALEQMEADYAAQMADEARQRGGLSLSDANEGELSLVPADDK